MTTLKKYFVGKDSEEKVLSLRNNPEITNSEESPETTTELGYWDKERKLWVESNVMKSNWESI